MKKRSKKKMKRRLKKANKKALHQKALVESVKREESLSSDEADAVLELDQDITPVLEGYDENLLARVKTHWFFGEWQQLVALDMALLRTHPERDRFALLIASAHQQLGEHDKARKFIRMALDWECPPKVVAQVLIAGVHNTLGRAAALSQDDARISRHFEASVAAIGTKDSALVSHARSVREMARMGLLPQAASLVDEKLRAVIKPRQQSPYQQEAQRNELKAEIELLQYELSLSQKNQSPKEKNDDTDKICHTTFSKEAYAFYQGISRSNQDNGAPPFILLDSKSLPRSGLHYMKKTFAKLLQGHFSFCEWYQEPGCCKKMPCALTGYAQQCKKTKTSRLRLIKSHDFELTDPSFSPIYSVRRVILIRDPLFILTSWFALDQFTYYKTNLGKACINMEKIWLSHEPEVLETAYQIMDDSFITPDVGALTKWLSEKTDYIIKFLNRWALPTMDKSLPFFQLVRYEEINSFILAMLDELRDHLPHDARQRINDFVHNNVDKFQPRKNPYTVRSDKLSAYLLENSGVFINAAENITKADRGGLMYRT